MGARLYNPATGRFLTRDAIPGGNDNTYTYPADPINKFDLDGKWWSRKKWGRALKKVAKGVNRACGFGQWVPGAIGTGCSVYRVGYAYATKGRNAAFKASVGLVASKFGGAKVNLIARHSRRSKTIAPAFSRGASRYRVKYTSSRVRYARNFSSFTHGYAGNCSVSRRRSCLYGR